MGRVAVVEQHFTRVDTTVLTLEVSADEWIPSNTRPHTLFRPTEGQIEWRNGQLERCMLRGPRVHGNGTEYSTGEWAAADYVHFGGDNSYTPLGLREDTPPWVVELVDYAVADIDSAAHRSGPVPLRTWTRA